MCSWASLHLGQSESDTGGAAGLQRSSQTALRLTGFVHVSGNIHKQHEMEGVVLVGSLTQQTFPHTGTPKTTVWAPFHSYSVWREASGSEMQLLHHCCCEGFVSLAPTPSAAFLVSQTPGVLCGSVPY